MNKEQTERVKDFFDEIAEDYSGRYTNSRPFLSFFHKQRIEAALNEQDFTGKKIWDIGAGTGVLKTFLEENNKKFNYFANDISAEMQINSSIEKEKYFVGQAENAPSHFNDFQSIFLLGVTTYLPSKELIFLLQDTLVRRTTPDADLFITFTNKSSLDFKLRQIIKFFSAVLPENRYVVGQKFTVQAYSPQEVSILLPRHFQIKKIILLNQSLPLFNRLFPKISVRLARKIFQTKDNFLKRWLSSDFLIVASSTK